MMIAKNSSWKSLILITVLVSNFLGCDGVDLQSVIASIIKDNQNMCFKCGFAIGTIMNIVKSDDPLLAAETKIKPMCNTFKLSKEVCSGIIELFVPVLADISKLISIKPQQMCSMFMEGICPGVSVPKHDWIVKLPNVSKPPIEDLPLPEVDRSSLKVLQLNDIHLDLHYSEGSNANCQDPLCCRSFSNNKQLGVYYPAGRFAPSWVDIDKHQMTWLLSELYSLWKDWLPESAKSTFLLGGFYSILIRPGFRVISLNTNFAHNLNCLSGLQINYKTRKLLAKKVHIMGHIPPGDKSCLKTWSENYYRIINRYENIVVAQFHAHTHADEFEIFYDQHDNARPVSVSYIGPSLTPFLHYNPAYRMYFIDSKSTWEVLDHETWTFDLDKANSEINKNPEWYLSYSARNAYNLTSLRPTEWNKLIQKMKKDDSIFQIFYKNYHRSSPSSYPSTSKIKDQILCNLKSGKSHSQEKNCGMKVQFPNIKFKIN
ncbi:hypothetical protein FQR65_LT18220 [Abscondita terminalis]|nr:hypothetical protein FQR65_LT18220 [Abscondita terminalis]